MTLVTINSVHPKRTTCGGDFAFLLSHTLCRRKRIDHNNMYYSGDPENLLWGDRRFERGPSKPWYGTLGEEHAGKGAMLKTKVKITRTHTGEATVETIKRKRPALQRAFRSCKGGYLTVAAQREETFKTLKGALWLKSSKVGLGNPDGWENLKRKIPTRTARIVRCKTQDFACHRQGDWNAHGLVKRTIGQGN